MMNIILKHRLTAVIFTLLFINSVSIAQNRQRHSFEIGPEVYYFHYEELEEWRGIDWSLMDEDGIFCGVGGSYTFRGWLDDQGNAYQGGLLLREEGRFAAGRVDYEGQTWDDEPLTFTDVDDRTMELRSLIGFGGGGLAGLDAEAYIYSGFGYRYLNDDSSEFAGGYERESNYYYLPVGISGIGRGQWDGLLGLTLEVDVLLHGLQKSHLSDADPTLPDVENKQTRGWGMRSSLQFEFPISERNAITVEPFLRFWAIDKSEAKVVDADTAVFEPRNETVEVGVNMMIRF
jgi:hypothetical protein